MAISFLHRKYSSRFTDLFDEPVNRLLSPIKGYQDQPLVSLTKAIEPVSSFFNGIHDYVYVALHNCQNPSDGLDQQESASIHLYTMQFDNGPSVYFLLNQSLRAENREQLKAWFPFLKLFLTALHKLPSERKTLWRGIRDVDLSSKYKTGTQFAWWGVSSCTTNIEVLESNQFLGKDGVRTVFSIECQNGKSIVNHSYYNNKEKEVILMPGSYFEVIGQINPAPQLHIIQLVEIPPPVTLVASPFSKSSDKTSSSSSSPSMANKATKFLQKTSNMIKEKISEHVQSKPNPLKSSEADLAENEDDRQISQFHREFEQHKHNKATELEIEVQRRPKSASVDSSSSHHYHSESSLGGCFNRISEQKLARGSIVIDEADPQGNFIILHNSGCTSQNQEMKGWTIQRTVDTKDVVYRFPHSFVLKSRERICILSRHANKNSINGLETLVAQDIKTWGTGSYMTTRLLDADGCEKALFRQTFQ